MGYCKDCKHSGPIFGGYWVEEPKSYLWGLIKIKGEWDPEEALCSRFPKGEWVHPFHSCGEFEYKNKL